MIEIEELTVEYKSRSGSVTALENFSMKLNKGDVCAIIGPSGSGKSTLLYVLSGILNDYSGRVLINKKPPHPKTQRLGYIPQNYGLLDWLSVYKNAVLGLEIKKDGYNNAESDKSEIDQIFAKLGLHDIKNRYPSQLSGGQRQRVSIARSFILKPDVLLMDEPFSALDAITREEVQDMFLGLWREKAVSTIFVTHSIEEAVYLGKKIAIMSPAPGSIINILDNPLFDRQNLRLTQEYYEFCLEIRKIVKEVWMTC